MTLLSNIRIVLVNTSHPGNIGSAARAMKTMGLSRLYLVAPKSFPDAKATELAAGADSILCEAVSCETLFDAIEDCQLVIGTSARPRDIPLPGLDPRQCAEKAHQSESGSQVAIVFGRESAGLTNPELLLCHYHVTIPANPDYSSLNLAAAVQVICYELRMAQLMALPKSEPDYDTYPTSAELERFYEHLEKTLMQIGFLKPRSPKRLMPRFRRLFMRSRIETMELNMMRGVLSAVDNTLEKVSNE